MRTAHDDREANSKTRAYGVGTLTVNQRPWCLNQFEQHTGYKMCVGRGLSLRTLYCTKRTRDPANHGYPLYRKIIVAGTWYYGVHIQYIYILRSI